MRRRRGHRATERLRVDVPEARPLAAAVTPRLERRSRPSGLPVSEVKTKSDSFPKPFACSSRQLGDERLVGPVEERHLAHGRPRLRLHAPRLLAATERGELLDRTRTTRSTRSMSAQVKPGSLRSSQARVGDDVDGVAVGRRRRGDQPLDLDGPQDPTPRSPPALAAEGGRRARASRRGRSSCSPSVCANRRIIRRQVMTPEAVHSANPSLPSSRGRLRSLAMSASTSREPILAIFFRPRDGSM